MFFNNLKIAYRYLIKSKTFSFISIFGLTIGFISFIMISMYIHDELNFDSIHDDAKIIYRVLQHDILEDGTERTTASVAGRIGPESVRQFPEIIESCRLTEFGRLTMGNDPVMRGYERLIVADSNFFKFFDYVLKDGNPATVLTAPDAVVLSEKLVTRYFGDVDPIGKTIWINGNDMYVTGVMDDFPSNTHLQIDLLFSQASVDKYFPWYRRFETTDWSANSFATYVKIKNPSDVQGFEAKLTNLVKQNYPPDKTFNSQFQLQSIGDIHLNSEGIQDYQVNASGFNTFYVYMFSVVAFLILIIACLNYMNLSTAAAFKRTKEIGTRKTLGAGKGMLIGQFIGIAILISFFSLILAISIVQIILPNVNEFLNKNLTLSALSLEWTVVMLFVLIGSGVLASLYPAFVVSKISPVLAIKNEIQLANSSIPVRKLLVIVQFSISIMMIASTLIIYRQLNYVREKELGFNADNLITIDINSGILRRQFAAIKTEFGKVAGVQSVAVSSRVPGEWKNFPIAYVQKEEESINHEMIFVGIDHNFLETFQIELLEGRNFSELASDSSKVLITRKAAEQLNLENPLGHMISIPEVRFGSRIFEQESAFQAEVIGIVEDFHFESLRNEMRPLIFAYHNNPIHSIDYYTLRINTNNWDETLQALKQVNDNFDPINPVEYNFLDSKFEEFYHADKRRGEVFLIFSSVIILIACMGLYALVSFSVENRQKEIGVRKVLGASVQSIVSMLSKEFILLIIVAFVIATPAVILIMREWLAEFAYHVNIGSGTLIIAGISAITIAMITISLKSIKAAVANPVDSLRSE